MMRLDFESVQHCGRKEELEKLAALFQTSCAGKAEAVIIQASSGRGKTALLEAFELQVVSDRALLCSGKFEERTAASEPFSAICEATTELFQNLASDAHTWRHRIQDALGDEIVFLQDIFPGMQVLFPNHLDSDLSVSSQSPLQFEAFGNMADKEWRFERFRLAVRSLFRCVSTFAPIVLMLDDLHWIDLDSFSLVKTILKDTHPGRQFLFVGASRMTERYHCLHELRDASFNVDFINLQCLSVDNLTNLLMDLLKREDECLTELAEIIYEKTSGNSFVVLHLLRILEQQELIFYSSDNSQWQWDSERILNESSISENITEVVADNLKTLGDSQKRALAIAAIFRTSYFDVKTIVHAMAFLGDKEEIPADSERPLFQSMTDPYVVAENLRELNDQLRSAARMGLVKETSPGHYKFAHDRIREAAYSLLPEGDDKKTLHLKIGRQLRSWMETSNELGLAFSEESLLLHTTKQLTLGSSLMSDRWEKLDLAELNFQAAELAAQKSSFFPAIEYLKQGLQQLGHDPWNDRSSLMYKLSVALLRIEYCCGLSANCIQTADDVLAHAKDFEDKCPVYHTKILCLLQQEKQQEAQNLTIAVLKELGQDFPRRFLMLHVIRDFLRARKSLKGLSDEEIISIPEVDEERLNKVAGFLERLLELSFLGGDPEYFFLAMLRFCRLMFERGRFPWTLSFFNGWGYARVVMGDLNEAFRFGSLALRLIPTSHVQHDARMKVVFWSFIYQWRLPLRDGIEPFRTAIDELWEHGALDFIHQDAPVFYRVLFVCGERLDHVLSESVKFAELLADYKQEIQWNYTLPLLQAVANLQGKSLKPTILTGEYMDEDERKIVWKKSGNKQAVFQYQFFSMMLACHFNDYERAEKTIMKMQPLFEDGPDPLVQPRVLYAGLVYWARFKATQRSSFRRWIYMRKANAALRQLKNWADSGAVSCVPMHLLLVAESLSAKPGTAKGEVIAVYDKAIQGMRKLGVCHHEALANELAGAYLIGQSDPSSAAPFLVAAIKLYDRWGAVAKVEDVHARYGDLTSSMSDLSMRNG